MLRQVQRLGVKPLHLRTHCAPREWPVPVVEPSTACEHTKHTACEHTKHTACEHTNVLYDKLHNVHMLFL